MTDTGVSRMLIAGLAAMALAACSAPGGAAGTTDAAVGISGGAPSAGATDVCAIETAGTVVEVVRPGPNAETPIDDVNWFARPVPNEAGHWVIAFASHNQNYLYDLTDDRRIRIPDRSDAVATPDGRYMTVPSHYTADNTVNFYDNRRLLTSLAEGVDADDHTPVFAHRDPDVHDVYYQSVGVVSSTSGPDGDATVYRMMFSGGRFEEGTDFRIVDYTFTTTAAGVSVTPTAAMSLCPQIVEDMNTPFISKDGRYVVAHDNGDASRRASLKIFEITGVHPERQATTCEERVDFGFAAGKADFSFDGTQVTFHVAKNDYLKAFVDGGLERPVITDVAIVDLETDGRGDIVGSGELARVTTSTQEGIGNYFPAFLPDGRLFYISNATPKDDEADKRFSFTVVDPTRELRMANVLADPDWRARAAAIGTLWRETCAPEMSPFQRDEAAWYFASLSPDQCRTLVGQAPTDAVPDVAPLLAACDRAHAATDRPTR